LRLRGNDEANLRGRGGKSESPVKKRSPRKGYFKNPPSGVEEWGKKFGPEKDPKYRGRSEKDEGSYL